MGATIVSWLTKGLIALLLFGCGVLLIYFLVRVGAFAWFKTKKEFDERERELEQLEDLNRKENGSGSS